MVLYQSPVLSHVIHASSVCMMTEKMSKNGSYECFTSLAGSSSCLFISTAGFLNSFKFFVLKKDI
jgi:hypothetical protein